MRQTHGSKVSRIRKVRGWVPAFAGMTKVGGPYASPDAKRARPAPADHALAITLETKCPR